MTNYTAHMSTGGTLALIFKNGVDTRSWLQDGLAWLVGDNGVMVNTTYVAALVPIAVPEKPTTTMRRFRDTDGEIWTQQPDGLYRELVWPWADVVELFGPLEEVTEND